jgi:hypothetical protein
MTRWFVWVIYLLSCASILSAGEQENPGYEIIGHTFRLQLFPSQSALSCVDTITVHITSKRSPEKIGLKFFPLYTVEEITLRGKIIDYKKGNDEIELKDIPSDSVFEYVISYHGTWNFHSEFSAFAENRIVLREEEFLPSGPRILRYVRSSIVVPKDWNAIAPGTLVLQTSVNDSMLFVSEVTKPIPMLGWICAGKFRQAISDSGGVRVTTYLFDEDSSASQKLLSQAHEVLRYYGKKFSPYRFNNLSIVEVEDWVAGKNVLAIAVPSIIMVKKLSLTTDDRFNQATTVLPHEIAHQWWPMTVYINDEDGALLSEGMCDYSSYLFNERTNVLSSRDSLSHNPLLRPLIKRAIDGKDLPLQQKADLRSLPTHYLKAAYVHNMLRHIIGDSVFSILYYEYAHRFAGVRVGMNEFRQLAEELSGKKLGWFFEQWVTKRGIPRMKMYNVKSTQHEQQWVTRGRVRMVGYDKYTTQVDVGVRTDSSMSKTTVFLGADSAGNYHNDVPFEIITETKPDRALLDPFGDVLKIQKLPMKLGDLRDPSDGVMIVGTIQHSEYLHSLARKDSAEMDRAWWSLMIKPDTAITLEDLQREYVFIYGKVTENHVAADFEKKFPYSFRGDSIIVNREAIFDSTLALLQCIENPHIAQGFVAWVAPLSERAQPQLLPFDASWAIVKGKEIISSGTWTVKDEDLEVEIK